MKSKPVALTILFWVETIVSIRILLFTIPVLISKCRSESYSINALEDRFIAILTIAAVIYALVGIASIVGSGSWKILHYLAVILTLAVNVGSLYVLEKALTAPEFSFYAPVAVAMLFTAFAVVLGSRK